MPAACGGISTPRSVIADVGGHLAAEPLRVGVSFAIPPYVISHEDRGIELDLMREAFAGSPHELQVVYLPLERTFRMLEEGKLDAIINVKPGMLESAYLSQPVITFHNRVFTLAPTAVHTMKDLQTLRVSAFQRARQILGTTFSDIVDQNPRYEEVARQEGPGQRLLLGRTDAVILEQRVFYYYLAQLLGDDQEGDRYPMTRSDSMTSSPRLTTTSPFARRATGNGSTDSSPR